MPADEGIFVIPLNVQRPKWSITITNPGGSETDVSAYLIQPSVSLGATDTISNFTFKLDNKEGVWTTVFSKGAVVKIYADYSDGTEKIFEGILETIRYVMQNGLFVIYEGRDYGRDALNTKVTKKWDAPDTITNIFEWLITNKLPTHSTDFTNIANITTEVQPNWNAKPVWNCMQDLILWSGGSYQFFCDENKKWNLFLEGTRTVIDYAVTYGQNVTEMEIIDSITQRDYANRVFIYGRPIEGIPILKCEDLSDTSPHSTYGVFEKVISNNNLITNSALNTEAENKINELSTIEDFGSCTCIGLPTVKPGYMIWVINPYCNVQQQMLITNITHTFGTTGFFTSLEFTQKEKGLIKVLGSAILVEQETSAIDNPFDMEHSYVQDFLDINYGANGTTPDADAMLETMSQTVVWDNSLMLQLLQTTGYAITKTHTAGADVTECVVIAKGSNLESDVGANWVQTWISVDNGVTWEDCPRETLHTVIATGTQLKIKIQLISLTTKIKALGMLYK